jgi:hypothetical protein
MALYRSDAGAGSTPFPAFLARALLLPGLSSEARIAPSGAHGRQLRAKQHQEDT